MSYLNSFIYYITLVVFVFLALQSLYLFIFALAGRLITLRKYKAAHQKGSFVIYIPAYKEDAVIVDTAKAALALNYPAYRKHIVVIADSLQPATLLTLRQLPIQVVEVSFEKSTKAKALNIALQKTAGEYDYALILDADNVCAKGFLYRMNDVLQTGFKLVQGQRVAKNTNTTFALLDAISEGINNHIFRKGHRALGLSSAVIGSGMAIEFSLFKTIMPQITAIGGFDKELQLSLLHNHIRFGYAQKAIVYDEKVMQQTHFENQRKRWLSAQLHYLRRYFFSGCLHLLKGNVDFFDSAIQTALIPRIMLLGVTPIAALLSLLGGPGLSSIYWIVLSAVTYFAIIISVPKQYFSNQLLKALLFLPTAFLSMAKLLFKLKGANTTFLHTPHGGDIKVQ